MKEIDEFMESVDRYIKDIDKKIKSANYDKDIAGKYIKRGNKNIVSGVYTKGDLISDGKEKITIEKRMIEKHRRMKNIIRVFIIAYILIMFIIGISSILFKDDSTVTPESTQPLQHNEQPITHDNSNQL